MFVTNIIRLERKLNINKLYEKVLYRLEEILSNLLQGMKEKKQEKDERIRMEVFMMADRLFIKS